VILERDFNDQVLAVAAELAHGTVEARADISRSAFQRAGLQWDSLAMGRHPRP
jgi:hypothetical protein